MLKNERFNIFSIQLFYFSHSNFFNLVFFSVFCRRKKKCIRFIVGADGETTEVPDKDQVEHNTNNSDSENENNNASITASGGGAVDNRTSNNVTSSATNNNPTNISSLKENLQERVSMTTVSKENKLIEQQHQQNALNNNNNNNNTINILSTSQSTAPIHTHPSHPSYQMKNANNNEGITTLYPPSVDHHHLHATSSFTNALNSVAFNNTDHQTARNDTSTIDSSVLKTISAPCS